MSKKEIIKDIIITVCVTIGVIVVVSFYGVYSYNKSLNEPSNDNNNQNTNTNNSRYSSDELERKQDEEMRRKEAMENEKKEKETVEEKNDQNEISEQEKIKIEKAKELFNEAKIIYDKQQDGNRQIREQFNNVNKNLIDRIKQMDYVETTDNCNDSNTCYTNGTYTVENYKDVYFTFHKSLDPTLHNIYNTKGDFDYLSSIYGLTFTDELISTVNKFLNSAEGLYSSESINIDSNGINVHFRYDNKEISYMVDDSLYDLINKVNYFDGSFYDYDFSKVNSERKKYYDYIANYNKANYTYYDIVDLYFSRKSESICNIKIDEKNYFSIDASLCHQGSSDTYFKFDYIVDFLRVYDTITIDFNKDYFKANYLDIINNDLKYFSNKLGYSVTLNNDNINKINNYINNNEKSSKIIINDDFKIEISSNYFYSLKYIIG